MKTKESIYVRVLLWAYEKKDSGFTREDLREHFSLGDHSLVWVNKMFFEGSSGDKPLIGHLSSSGGFDYFALTDKGISAAISYLDLKETREGSKRAELIAISSIVIGVFVGILQIIVQLFDFHILLSLEDFTYKILALITCLI